MGLSCACINFLALTRRKSENELSLSINAARKMALARESKDLAREQNAMRSAKKICYYEQGKYNKVNYSYLMGNCNYMSLLNDNIPFKNNYDMVLSDYTGKVVISNEYARHIRQVLGSSCIDALGNGSTFPQDKIPAIIASITGFSEDEIVNGIDSWLVNSNSQTTSNQTNTGSGTLDVTEQINSQLMNLIDIYYPIFQAASANGWTTRYNNDMATNPDYISDQLISGNFQLFEVNCFGQYEPDTNLNYFVTSGSVSSESDTDKIKDINEMYELRKSEIKEKEDWLDLENTNLSTELEAIKALIEQFKKMATDNINRTFDASN